MDCPETLININLRRVTSQKNENINFIFTLFKYLEYRTSEYKSDLKDKLQICNKINGTMRRYFGKQMYKEKKKNLQHYS
jgi:hypothetical protein